VVSVGLFGGMSMIRGPVLPLQRDGLWRLIRQRSGLFERGFRVIAEQIELGTAGLPPVDGLLRDAGGSPVLVFATDDRDTSLTARVLAAHAFWLRNADGMARALPEADLRDGAECRLLVIGVALRSETIASLQRLQIAGLEVLEVDTFRMGGQERVVVRAHGDAAKKPAGRDLDESVCAAGRSVFESFEHFARRLDAKIRIEGDRFSRRASFEGRLLGDLWFAEGAVHALVSGGAQRRIDTDADLRTVCDLIARRYLQVHGPATETVADAPAADEVAEERLDTDMSPTAFPANGLEAVRACLSTSRLTREEREALLDPAYGRDQEERTPGS
jgi:hypothetical protein